MTTMDPTHEQIRAARALLGWTQQELAVKSCVGVMTVKRLETGSELRVSQRRAVVATLIDGGIVFMADGTEIGTVTITDGVAKKKD